MTITIIKNENYEEKKKYNYDVLMAMKEALKISKDPITKKYDNFDEVMEDLYNAL